jgi:hypothetical protein
VRTPRRILARLQLIQWVVTFIIALVTKCEEGSFVKVKLRLRERFSDITCLLLLIKCAQDDSHTRTNLWRGVSADGPS